MTRVRNATDFLLKFRGLRAAYERVYVRQLGQIRAGFAATGKHSQLSQGQVLNDEDDWVLEAQVRAYLVDPLLSALNWRMDVDVKADPNLFPEVGVQSVERGTRRFLDYLGIEIAGEAPKPLLMVESKSPGTPPPARGRSSAAPEPYAVAEAVCAGLAGEQLRGQWNKWLGDLRDYVRSLNDRAGQAPRRVVITNGNWLILFISPATAFLSKGAPEPSGVRVWVDRNDIERRCSELFLLLEHQNVLGEAPELTLGELPFHITPEAIGQAMHGLRLWYEETRRKYAEPLPRITVAPVIFLRSRYGAWLRVRKPTGANEFELPPEPAELRGHLTRVQQAAASLLQEANQQLSTRLTALPLVEHYGDEEAFEDLPGVTEVDRDEFVVLTGDAPHYLLPQPSTPNCPYHDWGNSQAAGVATSPAPIVGPRTNPRCFFCSGEVHHCAHRDVYAAKSAQLTPDNRDRCGARSGRDGDSFCEIWAFEQFLCRRACVFYAVCTRATAFRLPCAGVQAGQAASQAPQGPTG